EGYSGDAIYNGLEDVLQIDNAFVHIYGKHKTKPGRKMGHITVMSNEKADLVHKANKIKSLVQVVAKN
ncbi:MAG TPA: hypothetical protein VM871_08910, partial [Flavisolibacter sp.]|nr:hypothetical protein [Flavisolibacter sp.]